jgi:hypothetical protein
MNFDRGLHCLPLPSCLKFRDITGRWVSKGKEADIGGVEFRQVQCTHVRVVGNKGQPSLDFLKITNPLIDGVEKIQRKTSKRARERENFQYQRHST